MFSLLRPKRMLIWLALAALLLGACAPAVAPAAPPAATATAPTATPEPAATAAPTSAPAAEAAATGEMTLKAFDLTSEALAGNLLGDSATRTIYILLPPGYESGTRRYPVVYALHGYYGDSSSLAMPFKQVFEEARKSGKVQDMIFVFPDADNKLGGSWYRDSPTTGGYETYIVKELVSYVDANYRTLAQVDSRGITGCSMGGDGTAHLALTHPDVFSVAAPVAGAYDWSTAYWGKRGEGFRPTTNWTTWSLLTWQVQSVIAYAAAVAPNPDNPPFYLDMPWVMSGDQAQVVPAVFEKIAASDATHEVQQYVKGSQRLRALMLLHGRTDDIVPIEYARAFDKLLTDLNIEHTLVEEDAGHCQVDEALSFMPAIQFMSDHLVSEP